jgi:hypothetical protein
LLGYKLTEIEMPRERKEETMNTAWLDAKFAPVRENSHRTAMLASRANLGRSVQIATLTAILEGTMAAAVQILGAEDAFNLIQPLADRALNPALPGHD